MNPTGKRLPDKARVSHEDLRESVDAWAKEIISKCRNHKMPVGVILVVVPLDDPKPQWAHNLSPQNVQELLRHVGTDIAVKGGGIAIVPAGAMPKA